MHVLAALFEPGWVDLLLHAGDPIMAHPNSMFCLQLTHHEVAPHEACSTEWLASDLDYQVGEPLIGNPQCEVVCGHEALEGAHRYQSIRMARLEEGQNLMAAREPYIIFIEHILPTCSFL